MRSIKACCLKVRNAFKECAAAAHDMARAGQASTARIQDANADENEEVTID
jgi:hypothetical protein